MKFSLRLVFIFLLIFTISAIGLRAQDRPPQTYDHAIYEQIEQAYQNDNLSLDQKILFKFYAGRNPNKLPQKFRSEKTVLAKCGTPAIADYQNHKEQLSRSTVSEVESMMQRPTTQASETYQSPSGNFTIHYETTGEDAVPAEDQDSDGIPDYVEEVAAAADSSYRHEVQTLGYSDPISSSGSIDVFIRDLATPNFLLYGQSNGTLIEIENDFSEGFPPNDHPEGNQSGAVKVTMAHELKHVVQYEASQWQGEIFNWLEMDATLMEEVVFDNVNDYYNYIQTSQSIFNNPQNSFYPSDGASYYIVSWALYFEERYGSQFWVDVWEIIQANPTITMVDALTQQLGGAKAFNENYIASQLWHYASGSGNSSPNFGFEESAAYPAPPIENEERVYDKNLTIPRPSPLSAPTHFAARYFNIPLPDDAGGDIRLEATSRGENKGAGLIAYYQDGRVESTTAPILDANPSVQTSDLDWNNIDRLGLVLTNSSPTPSEDGGDDPIVLGIGSSDFNNTLSHNYPNPFNPQTRIRFTLEQASQVELKVYDSAGRLVRTLIDRELSAGLYEPVFDGSNLASGVYFYRLITDRQTLVKKMTLIK